VSVSAGAIRMVTGLLVLPACLSAQTDPRLVSALRLAQEGLGDSARAVISRLVARTEPTDTLYPQMLYTRGLISADPRDMRNDLQRVAVEYASSNWADDALLRLALLDYAGGQLDASARTLERIALDHSTSPLYPRAALWAGRVYFERPPADSFPVRPPGFRIQIAAVNTAGAADAIAARARATGIETVVTREGPYYKVRVGSYPTRTEAAAALPAVRARFRGMPFVVAVRE